MSISAFDRALIAESQDHVSKRGYHVANSIQRSSPYTPIVNLQTDPSLAHSHARYEIEKWRQRQACLLISNYRMGVKNELIPFIHQLCGQAGIKIMSIVFSCRGDDLLWETLGKNDIVNPQTVHYVECDSDELDGSCFRLSAKIREVMQQM